MTEQEKEVLRLIPTLKMEAKSMLRLISHLQNSGKGNFENEINKWLDRVSALERMEEELKNKK